jgi:hypothetical protein
VIIEWEDAKLDTEYDGPIVDAPAEPIICHDIGWRIKKTKKVVVLAQSVSFDTETARVITVIPRKLVINELELVGKGVADPKDARKEP